MSPPSTVSHRRGTRVDYLPHAQGPAAPWPDVIAAAIDPGRAAEVGARASVVIRTDSPTRVKPDVHSLSVPKARELSPDDLLEVRRPVSYEGMPNYIGRMSLPTRRDDPDHQHAGWFESRNEQETYRELLMTRPITAMATQPMRLEWPLPGGARTHVPDAVYATTDGTVTLLDVTRRARLESAEAVAIFRLTSTTAAALGWSYQVRVELEPQHQRNVAAVWACRRARPDHAALWQERARSLPSACQFFQAADHFGGADRPSYGAVMHLIANRHLFMNLTAPMTIDAVVRTRPLPVRSHPCLVTP